MLKLLTDQIPQKYDNIRLDMSECLLIIPIDVPITVVSV